MPLAAFPPPGCRSRTCRGYQQRCTSSLCVEWLRAEVRRGGELGREGRREEEGKKGRGSELAVPSNTTSPAQDIQNLYSLAYNYEHSHWNNRTGQHRMHTHIQRVQSASTAIRMKPIIVGGTERGQIQPSVSDCSLLQLTLSVSIHHFHLILSAPVTNSFTAPPYMSNGHHVSFAKAATATAATATSSHSASRLLISFHFGFSPGTSPPASSP